MQQAQHVRLDEWDITTMQFFLWMKIFYSLWMAWMMRWKNTCCMQRLIAVNLWWKISSGVQQLGCGWAVDGSCTTYNYRCLGFGPFCDCFWMCIPDPCTSMYGEICTQIIICGNELSRLSKDAPALWRQHLLALIESAKEDNNVNRVKAITEILKREAHRKHWQRIFFLMRPPQGGNPISIRVQTP